MAFEFATEEDPVLEVITPRKLRKWELLAIGLQTFSAATVALADGLRDMAGVLLRQSEYEQMRHEFMEDAASELETLIAEVEHGSAE